MAILQLSRITNRKGLMQDLPQLSGAEFGWVIDERRLFVGNGTIADGAPIIGNTEILTEFSDILALSSTYTYKGDAAGYIVQTGPIGENIVRSLQHKFDDIASVKDFGAMGDGTTDDTLAINRALYELFCREVNPQIRRSLFFPAGVYVVSDIIKVPPHAKLWGEGLTSSIIQFQGATLACTAMVAGQRYVISSLGLTGTFPGTLDNGTANPTTPLVGEVFIASGPGTGDGTVRYVPKYVVTTADSLQQVNGNIGNAGAQYPTGIEMESMAIYSLEENTLLYVDSCTDSGFHYIGLQGPRISQADHANGNTGYLTSGVEIVSSSFTSHDLTFSKVISTGTTYGLTVNDYVRGVVYESGNLEFHYQGCRIGDAVLAGHNGPTGVVITRNIFDNIAYEGIYFGNDAAAANYFFNSSAFNVFYGVGDNFSSPASPASPVIRMAAAHTVSVGDLFERSDANDAILPRIGLYGNGGIALDSTHSIHLGAYERQVGIDAVLTDNTAIAATIFTMTNTVANAYRVDYHIKRSNADARMGWMYISINNGVINFNDEFSQTQDVGVIFDVIQGVGTYDTSLQYTTTSTGQNATFTYSVVRLD